MIKVETLDKVQRFFTKHYKGMEDHTLEINTKADTTNHFTATIKMTNQNSGISESVTIETTEYGDAYIVMMNCLRHTQSESYISTLQDELQAVPETVVSE
ncbi:hypothetical protein [Sporosarcina sp. A2]|uniref:hypothetical protein n=1 Tax=Sporosarcina sp. A2 TaxID=3393449 RepID=UPI003D7C0231